MKYEHGTEIVIIADTRVQLEEVVQALRASARGVYQRELASGNARWSGADLAGKAARYAGHYARSRASFADRIERAGYACEFVRVEHGRKVLKIRYHG
jgi:hypothetical protein